MKRTRLLVIGGAAAALVLGFLAVRYARDAGDDVSRPAGGAGNPPAGVRFLDDPKPVPELVVEGIDGRSISSADWRGKTTIVNFWATWCAPCLKEIPDFIAMQEKYADHLQIIGFSVDEGPADEVKRFVAEHEVTYPIAIVDADVQAKFGGIFGLPMSFVVDAEGRVVQRHIGLVSPSVYEREVRALAGLPVEVEGAE